MYPDRIIEMIRHLPRRVVREILGYAQLAPLPLINLFGRSQMTQDGGPVVSLTTYGQRAKTVYLAIESIARGEILPSRLILWIDEIELYKNLPPTIRRLQRRGLEVKLCKNYGTHKKYYPYVESQDFFDLPLVTADDDILYPRYWLKELIKSNREYPGEVNCYYAGGVEFEKDSGRMLVRWNSCSSTNSSYCHHPIGANGVIYPPSYLMALREAGTAFESCCPNQDDVWHHVIALRAGYKVRQIRKLPPYFSFQWIPGTSRSALKGRDSETAILATYRESEIQLLRATCGASSH